MLRITKRQKNLGSREKDCSGLHIGMLTSLVRISAFQDFAEWVLFFWLVQGSDNSFGHDADEFESF
jgi:hypothetical protein